MSEFMKDISDQAKGITPPAPEKELDILSRSVPKKAEDVIEEDSLVEAIKVPIVSKTMEEVVSDTTPSIEPIQHNDMIVEQLVNSMTMLQDQVSRLVELTESNTKKYPFPEGATATNHTTGNQIVFSRGQWWYLDDKK